MILTQNSFSLHLNVQLPLYLRAVCFMIFVPYPCVFLSFLEVGIQLLRTGIF